MQPHPILHFWFKELTPKQHFVKDAALDETIRTRFGDTLGAAVRCELFAWRSTAEGRLAEIAELANYQPIRITRESGKYEKIHKNQQLTIT
jgi:uncharacterized protein (DUF924 family)